MENIENQVKSFIVENFMFGQGGETLNASQSFLDAGVMDSTGVLELVSFLEEKFAIKIKDDELVPYPDSQMFRRILDPKYYFEDSGIPGSKIGAHISGAMLLDVLIFPRILKMIDNAKPFSTNNKILIGSVSAAVAGLLIVSSLMKRIKRKKDQAMAIPDNAQALVQRLPINTAANGGIDLTQNGMRWNIRRDPLSRKNVGTQDDGPMFKFDPAVIERVRREGVDFLAPRILSMNYLPPGAIWSLLGLRPPQ